MTLFMLMMTASGHTAAFNDPPARCEGLGTLQSISLTNWEAGLGAWDVDTHDIASPSDFDTPDWGVVSGLPDGRPGKAAFVADQDDWEICEIEDKSGALTLDSPPIIIPAGVLVPRISVDHWFALEQSSDGAWDGGNFKISVNGGNYTLIPASAIEVGPYNATLLPAEAGDPPSPLNTNPLAGQDVFSGPLLSWGQSHINLQGIADAGDTIKLRFDFGIDECAGDIGWYVDDVEFYYCSGDIDPSEVIFKDGFE